MTNPHTYLTNLAKNHTPNGGSDASAWCPKTMQGETLNTPLMPTNASQVENDKVHVFIVIVNKLL
jgi:hypothetical protein